MKDLLKRIEDRVFLFFLKRYINNSLDQWDRWEIESNYGNVYIQISRNSDGYEYTKIK